MKLLASPGLAAVAAAVAVLGGAACTLETRPEENLRDSIAEMLDDSAEAWNRGDLEGFLESFAAAPSTTFMTENGPVTGIESIRSGYEGFFDGSVPRDSLAFEDLTVRTFPPLIAVATLRYVLGDRNEPAATGWVTLVIRRTGDGWRIVHDHSS